MSPAHRQRRARPWRVLVLVYLGVVAVLASLVLVSTGEPPGYGLLVVSTFPWAYLVPVGAALFVVLLDPIGLSGFMPVVVVLLFVLCAAANLALVRLAVRLLWQPRATETKGSHGGNQ